MVETLGYRQPSLRDWLCLAAGKDYSTTVTAACTVRFTVN